MNNVFHAGRTASEAVTRGANAALVLLYWRIGEAIRTDILRAERAECGEDILPTPSAKSATGFGCGLSERDLAGMGRYSEAVSDLELWSALRTGPTVIYNRTTDH